MLRFSVKGKLITLLTVLGKYLLLFLSFSVYFKTVSQTEKDIKVLQISEKKGKYKTRGKRSDMGGYSTEDIILSACAASAVMAFIAIKLANVMKIQT